MWKLANAILSESNKRVGIDGIYLPFYNHHHYCFLILKNKFVCFQFKLLKLFFIWIKFCFFVRILLTLKKTLRKLSFLFLFLIIKKKYYKLLCVKMFKICNRNYFFPLSISRSLNKYRKEMGKGYIIKMWGSFAGSVLELRKKNFTYFKHNLLFFISLSELILF